MKPILFNTEMVRAILDGRKTTTRRVIKPQPVKFVEASNGLLAGCRCDNLYPDYGGRLIKYPYEKGDILYVRETFCKLWKLDGNDQIIEGTENYYYAADGYNPTPFNCFPDEDGFHGDRDCPKWHPSIHMPKEAARLFLRVTGVKAERLQDITENGAKDEGMVYTDFGMYQPSWKASVDGGKTFYPAKEQHHFGWNSGSAKGPGECFPTSHGAFAHLWDSTVNKSDLDHYGWSANPWVWVISFERTARPDEK